MRKHQIDALQWSKIEHELGENFSSSLQDLSTNNNDYSASAKEINLTVEETIVLFPIKWQRSFILVGSRCHRSFEASSISSLLIILPRPWHCLCVSCFFDLDYWSLSSQNFILESVLRNFSELVETPMMSRSKKSHCSLVLDWGFKSINVHFSGRETYCFLLKL